MAEYLSESVWGDPAMWNWLLDCLFGCAHRKLSLPITLRKKMVNGRPGLGPAAETYRVCLECGKQFPYNWEEMKIVRALPPRRAEVHGLVGWFSRHRWSAR